MNWTILHKYLSGECTREEKEEIEHWIDADEQNRELYDFIFKIWNVEPKDNITINAKAAWESLRGKLPDDKKKAVKPPRVTPLPGHRKMRTEPPHRKGYSRSAAVSLAAAGIAAAAVLLYMFLPGLNLLNEPNTQKSPGIQEISTAMGQRTSFRLADGTHVYLNAGSRIRISPDYGDSIRSIQLKGEAYFEVADEPGVPFIVHSGGSYTKVLGTKFGVRAYPRDEKVQVVVEEGEVEFGSSDKTVSEAKHLTKKQAGFLGSDGKISTRKLEHLENYLSWKDGRLVFESTSFEQVIPRLERWYNIEIKADPSLSNQKVTASFSDEPMTEVLNILAASLNADLKKDHRKISFGTKK